MVTLMLKLCTANCPFSCPCLCQVCPVYCPDNIMTTISSHCANTRDTPSFLLSGPRNSVAPTAGRAQSRPGCECLSGEERQGGEQMGRVWLAKCWRQPERWVCSGVRGCVTRVGIVPSVCKLHGQKCGRHGVCKMGWGGVCGRCALPPSAVGARGLEEGAPPHPSPGAH